METIKHFRLGIGFLVLFGTPPYLVYDFHKMAHGQVTALRILALVVATVAAVASVLWLSRQKGEDYARVKFLWEIPFALMILTLSAPLLLVVALLIKLESPGPVIYKQKRVGLNRRRKERRAKSDRAELLSSCDPRKDVRRGENLGGRPFTIYKFRSMKVNAEEQTGAAWSTGDHDPRVTRIGYYIRKTHIDEMPQLLNVLRGEMSVIGPRPERPDFIARLCSTIEGYRHRLIVQPGITGLAQVRQEHDESIEDVRRKLAHDKEYIRHTCLLLDLKIILQTVLLIINLLLEAVKRRTVPKVEPKALNTFLPERARIPERARMERG
ncbi:sugar transferase [Candidatus Poribacteria bacterium]|nr:sugar transferase [Candidatus Poribacteria bacterium]